MFGTVRKHQRWLWILIIVPTILSFVIWLSPDGRQGGGSIWNQKSEYGVVDGRQVTRDMILRASREAGVFAELYLRGPDSPQARQMGFELQRETFRRVLLSEKFKHFKIEVSDEAVAAWVREMSQGREGGMPVYDQWVEHLKQKNYTESELVEFLRHDIAQRHLSEVLGVAGELVTPREAETAFRRENEQAVVEVAFFPTSNQLAVVTVDPAGLLKFYSNQVARYRIPERVQASYVKFDVTNYTKEAEQVLGAMAELTNHLDQEYLRRGADAFRDKEDKVMSKEAAISQLRSEFVEQQALQFARGRAAEFANELYRIEPAKADNLDSLAAAKGLQSALSDPFPESGRPAGLDDVTGVGREVFKLSADQPFTTPVTGRKGIYLFALKQRFPSEVQPFEQVQARATEDYKRSRAAEALRIVGDAFHATATNGLAQGKSFGALAAENGATLLTPPPIALSASALPGFDQMAVDLGTLKNAAFSLKPGEVSSFTPTRGGGMVVFLKQKQPVDEARVKAELPVFTEELRKQNQGGAFGEWFAAEFERSGLARMLPQKNAAE